MDSDWGHQQELEEQEQEMNYLLHEEIAAKKREHALEQHKHRKDKNEVK